MFMLKVFFAFSTLLIAPSLGELSELSKEVFRGCRRNHGLHFCFSLFKDARDCVEIVFRNMPVDSSHAIKDSGFAPVKRHLRPLPFRVVEGGLWPVVGLWPQGLK